MSITSDDIWLPVMSEPITQAAEKRRDLDSRPLIMTKKISWFQKTDNDPDLHETY